MISDPNFLGRSQLTQLVTAYTPLPEAPFGNLKPCQPAASYPTRQTLATTTK